MKREHFYSIMPSKSGKSFAVYKVSYSPFGRILSQKIRGGFRTYEAAERWLINNR